MNLVKGRSYFISVTDAVLRAEADPKSAAVNHLIFGDWLKYLGTEKDGWANVHSRGDDGWLQKKWFSDKRILEVNFIDIGQGDGCHLVTPDDKIILIDSGIGDNMYRFISWRYNLRGRRVVGVDGVQPGDPHTRPPFEIDNVIISHPDQDHYYGFRTLFKSKKIVVRNVYHNGIVERPIPNADKDPNLKYYSGDDLGGYVKNKDGEQCLWDVVLTNGDMHDLIKLHGNTSKRYLSTLREAVANNKNVKFKQLSANDDFLPGYEAGEDVEFKVLGPVTEEITFNGKTRQGFIRLGNKGITKNGHSVILQLRIDRLKVMLGGDLNTESEDNLLRHYAETQSDASHLERKLYELKGKGNKITLDEKQELIEIETELEAIIAKGRRHFQADITKACHHGSHHFSETFLKVINSSVTVVSSGDDENYSHPRPDALGAFGKYSRGVRPLIFSTELARSTKEFINIYDYYALLKSYEERIKKAATESEKKALEKEMQERKDRNVAVYGMITLRTDGQKVVIAQKLERPGGADDKWDIHELTFNENIEEFEYPVSFG